jgi:hypothetical protein
MVTEEKIKCNICGGILVDSDQAKLHASTSSHELNKSRLEQDLKAVSIENYHDDVSVIMSWKKASL